MDNREASTIVALSTPRGHGGIAVVRLSGDRSLSIAQNIFTSVKNVLNGKTVYGKIFDENGFIDTAILTYYKAPNSYTGEDVVEISHHGNPFLSDLIIDACKYHGASGAHPGEFTKRAFLNGKMDLSQAEGVADIIYSDSRAALEASTNLLDGIVGKTFRKIKSEILDILTVAELELDFLEDEISRTSPAENIMKISSVIDTIDTMLMTYDYGKIIRGGIRCPIVGPPNSGKSSLFNALLQEERVIVSSQPGTTRDFIEESIRVGDYQIRLIDTAGIRDSANEIESAGIKKSKTLLDEGDMLLYIIDPADQAFKIRNFSPPVLKKIVFIINKSDISTDTQIQRIKTKVKNFPHFVCSAKKHFGIHEIALGIIARFDALKPSSTTVILTRQRHKEALSSAKSFLVKAVLSISEKTPPEVYAIDLRESLDHIDTILGKTTNDDILNNIFSNFCIGK